MEFPFNPALTPPPPPPTPTTTTTTRETTTKKNILHQETPSLPSTTLTNPHHHSHFNPSALSHTHHCNHLSQRHKCSIHLTSHQDTCPRLQLLRSSPSPPSHHHKLMQFPTLQAEIAAAANEALERFREDSKKTTLRLVEMESSYITADFFRKLPQDIDRGGNPAPSAANRYAEGHFQRIGSKVFVFSIHNPR